MFHPNIEIAWVEIISPAVEVLDFLVAIFGCDDAIPENLKTVS
jgi:hypothetical protein